MRDVLVPEVIPERTMKLSLLLKRHPIETCNTVEELVNCINSVKTTYNRAAIYVIYFIGRAFNEALLSKKYPGLTVEKLGAAVNIRRSTAYRYKRLAEILTPEEVDSLGHIPYFSLMKLPQIEKQFGEAAVKELKFRLQANDFEGARGTSAFDREVAKMAEERLRFALPGESAAVEGDAEDTAENEPPALKQLTDNAADEINSEVEEDSGSEDPVAKLLSDRQKQVSKGVSEKSGRVSKSELKQNAEIAFSQARGALTKLRNMYTRIRDDADTLLDKVWDNEAYIIGDPEVDQKYRELLEDVAATHQRVLETLLKLQKEYRQHGQCLGKIEMPDGATPTGLLDSEG